MLKKMYHLRTEDPEVKSIAAETGFQPEAVLEVLTKLFVLRGELSQESLVSVAETLDIPPERVYGIASFYSMLQSPVDSVLVCDSPACWLKGSTDILSGLKSRGSSNVGRTSCLGLCDLAPAGMVGEKQVGPLKQVDLPLDTVSISSHIPTYAQPMKGETRVLLNHAAEIDPFNLQSAIQAGVYQAIKRALNEPPMKVIEQLETSGLRGRGGAGFPVGRKWRFVAESAEMAKFIICNADESEPLTFKDRVLMDSNPHKILEGMLLAAYAVGAQEGFIYIRGEYTAQAQKLAKAIQDAEQAGWLGENIQGTDFSFHLDLHRGAGAYICGEETALIESLEGKRGEPRIRPPYPASYGYLGMPTIVNNVESFAYVPDIVLHGGEWYQSIGNPAQPGTKLYTLVGHVNQPGLFEAHYGLTLREIIEQFGQGMLSGSEFNLALTGGAAGTIVSQEHLDIPIGIPGVDGSPSLGSGAIMICDQSVSALDLLRNVLHFFEQESCGKCTPCRVGTRDSRRILDQMNARKMNHDARDQLLELAMQLKTTSFCGLGQSVAMPIQSAVKNFPGQFSTN